MIVECNCKCHKELERPFQGNSNSDLQSSSEEEPMTDDSCNDKLEVKSSEYKFLYQEVIESDEIDFENFIRYKPCPNCGHDHSFKPSFNDVQTSIEHASELISSFFNGGASTDTRNSTQICCNEVAN
jgi:hypothetical protein